VVRINIVNRALHRTVSTDSQNLAAVKLRVTEYSDWRHASRRSRL